MEEPPNNLNKVIEKAKLYGDLSLTAEDHISIGSTPDPRLEKNPGKAMYELLSDEEIGSWLDMMLELAKSEAKKVGASKRHVKEHLLNSIAFLKSIDKLPQRYDDEDTILKIRYDAFDQV